MYLSVILEKNVSWNFLTGWSTNGVAQRGQGIRDVRRYARFFDI